MAMSATPTTTSTLRKRLLAAAGVSVAAVSITCAVAPGAEAAPSKAPESAPSQSAVPAKPASQKDLNVWIDKALKIMDKHDIPGSYEGIHRNVMRESAGDPYAKNGWDINAVNGTPSIGLLQVIQPTFDAYHVKGTKPALVDPVANIVAACNYAADRYGSIDNVDGPY